jgi:hypothetical protein
MYFMKKLGNKGCTNENPIRINQSRNGKVLSVKLASPQMITYDDEDLHGFSFDEDDYDY